MPSPASNLRGILAMVLATGFFVANDSLMKVAAADLPPYAVVFLRGAAAAIGCGALLVVTGQWRQLAGALRGTSLLRGAIELGAVLCYIVALHHLPIADVVAIGQTAPLILVGLVRLAFHERIGPAKLALILLGFAGAILVAQPSLDGLSLNALLAFAAAALVALRDLAGKRIAAEVPALAAAFGTIIVVMAGSGLASALTETWVTPAPAHLAMLGLAGLLVTLAQVAILIAYRSGAAGVVAPFYYSFTVWALISGYLIWGDVPNLIATAGILLILASGLAIVFLDQWRARRSPSLEQAGA